MSTAPRVWLITGASRGLGRAFAEAALAAGDRVVAISRTPAPLGGDSHSGHRGDVTDRAAVFAAVEQAVAHFGRLDVVVNNAGAMWLGAVEEFSEEEARAAMELNFFGALWVTQAVAPHLRAGGGRLLQISSIGGVVTGPMAGLYSAAKFALEGMSEALAQELAPFGVHVTLVEPGGYWTDLYRSGMHQTEPLEAYAALRSGDGGGGVRGQRAAPRRGGDHEARRQRRPAAPPDPRQRRAGRGDRHDQGEDRHVGALGGRQPRRRARGPDAGGVYVVT